MDLIPILDEVCGNLAWSGSASDAHNNSALTQSLMGNRGQITDIYNIREIRDLNIPLKFSSILISLVYRSPGYS